MISENFSIQLVNEFPFYNATSNYYSPFASNTYKITYWSQYQSIIHGPCTYPGPVAMWKNDRAKEREKWRYNERENERERERERTIEIYTDRVDRERE